MPYDEYERGMDRDAEKDAEWFITRAGIVILLVVGLGIWWWVA